MATVSYADYDESYSNKEYHQDRVEAPEVVDTRSTRLELIHQMPRRLYTTPCPQHFSSTKASVHLLERISCSVCRRTILQLVSFSKGHRLSGRFYVFGSDLSYGYGGSCHFEDQLVTIIQDFKKMLRLLNTKVHEPQLIIFH